MKIVCKDNYCREFVADRLVAEGIKLEVEARAMCDALTHKYGGEDSEEYFEIVPDDYELWRGMRELV